MQLDTVWYISNVSQRKVRQGFSYEDPNNGLYVNETDIYPSVKQPKMTCKNLVETLRYEHFGV